MDWLDIDLPADSPWFVASIMGFWIVWAVFLVLWYKRTKAKSLLPKGKYPVRAVGMCEREFEE